MYGLDDHDQLLSYDSEDLEYHVGLFMADNVNNEFENIGSTQVDDGSMEEFGEKIYSNTASPEVPSTPVSSSSRKEEFEFLSQRWGDKEVIAPQHPKHVRIGKNGSSPRPSESSHRSFDGSSLDINIRRSQSDRPPTSPRSPRLRTSEKNVNSDGGKFDLNIRRSQSDRPPTSPRGPRLRTLEKNGHRQYSSFSKLSDDERSHDTESTLNSSPKPPRTLPRSPRLRTMEKNGKRLYSTSSSTRFNDEKILGDRQIRIAKRSSSATIPQGPRLRTMEKNGERQYSNSSKRPFKGFPTSPKSVSHFRGATIPRAPRLRTMEKKGERIYSFSTTPFSKNILSTQSWNRDQRIRDRSRYTVPVPFHLSSSPLKFSQKKKQSTPKFTFRALPLPDLSYKYFPFQGRDGTVPEPFDLSVKPTRRVRSLSPIGSPKMVEDTHFFVQQQKQQPFVRFLPKAKSESCILKRRNQKTFLNLSKRRRNSIKAKYKFTDKLREKRNDIRIKKRSAQQYGMSVNPNLNASRAAKRNHMLQVAAEVARLREEWNCYKHEAAKLLAELENAKREKWNIENKLKSQALISGAGHESAKLENRLSGLDYDIRFKALQYVEYKKLLEKNKKQQSRIITAYKKEKKRVGSYPKRHEHITKTSTISDRVRKNWEDRKEHRENRNSQRKQKNMNQPKLVTTKKKVRDSITRLTHDQTQTNIKSSVEKMKEVSSTDIDGNNGKHDNIVSLTESSSHNDNENQPFIDMHNDQLKDHSDKVTTNERDGCDDCRDSLIKSLSNDHEDNGVLINNNINQVKDHCDDLAIDEGDGGDSCIDSLNKSLSHDCEGKRALKNNSKQLKYHYDDIVTSESEQNDGCKDLLTECLSHPYDEVGKAITNKDDQLQDSDDVYDFESRDVSEEASPQRVPLNDKKHKCESNELEPLTGTKSVYALQKHYRPRQGFGDDFDVSSITNLFRGGWHRAPNNGHLVK